MGADADVVVAAFGDFEIMAQRGHTVVGPIRTGSGIAHEDAPSGEKGDKEQREPMCACTHSNSVVLVKSIAYLDFLSRILFNLITLNYKKWLN